MVTCPSSDLPMPDVRAVGYDPGDRDQEDSAFGTSPAAMSAPAVASWPQLLGCDDPTISLDLSGSGCPLAANSGYSRCWTPLSVLGACQHAAWMCTTAVVCIVAAEVRCGGQTAACLGLILSYLCLSSAALVQVGSSNRHWQLPGAGAVLSHLSGSAAKQRLLHTVDSGSCAFCFGCRPVQLVSVGCCGLGAVEQLSRF